MASVFSVKRTFLELEVSAALNVDMFAERPRAVTDSVLKCSYLDTSDDECCEDKDSHVSSETFSGASSVACSPTLSWAEMSEEEDAVSPLASPLLGPPGCHGPPGQHAPVMMYMMLPMAVDDIPIAGLQAQAAKTISLKSPFSGSSQDSTQSTTLILRKIPNSASREDVVCVLDVHGFSGLYDFLYVPMNFKLSQTNGFAIVNFSTEIGAAVALSKLNGAQLGGNKLAVEQSVAHVGGLHSLVARYQNSHVMESHMPEEYKPLLFSDGQRVPFPSWCWA